MRTPIIAGNWKMYKTVADTVKYVKEFRVMVKDIADVEIVIAPPFTAVHDAWPLVADRITASTISSCPRGTGTVDTAASTISVRRKRLPTRSEFGAGFVRMTRS